MNWYFYLHYFIYRYYKRKKDNMSGMYSVLASITLLSVNVITAWIVYTLITNFWAIPKAREHYKFEVITGMSSLALFNYLILYRKKKYLYVFDEFAKNSDKYKKWDKSVKWYIVLSIVVFLIVLIIADLRNHNFELYFLK